MKYKALVLSVARELAVLTDCSRLTYFIFKFLSSKFVLVKLVLGSLTFIATCSEVIEA